MKRRCAIWMAGAVLLAAGTALAQTVADVPAGPSSVCESTCSDAGASKPGPAKGEEEVDMGLLIFVFVLAIFLGVELIAKVPSQLHTPLMSGSNAISGITIVGALLAAGRAGSVMTTVLGVLAVAFAMINVTGGYLVTDRMLGMFKHKGRGGA